MNNTRWKSVAIVSLAWCVVLLVLLSIVEIRHNRLARERDVYKEVAQQLYAQQFKNMNVCTKDEHGMNCVTPGDSVFLHRDGQDIKVNLDSSYMQHDLCIHRGPSSRKIQWREEKDQ